MKTLFAEMSVGSYLTRKIFTVCIPVSDVITVAEIIQFTCILEQMFMSYPKLTVLILFYTAQIVYVLEYTKVYQCIMAYGGKCVLFLSYMRVAR